MTSRCQTCSVIHAPKCPTSASTLRWPTQALLDAVGGLQGLADRLGWTSSKGHPPLLSDQAADHYAVRCGLHPEQVWPGWCDAGLTDRDYRFIHNGGWRQAWIWDEQYATPVVEITEVPA